MDSSIFDEEEWEWLEKAVHFARDSAFLTTFDKNSEPVQKWNKLLDRVKVQRALAGWK